MSVRWRLTIGWALFGLMLIQLGGGIYSNILNLTQSSLRGWTAVERNNRRLITEVTPAGPAIGFLQVGDEIVSLEVAGGRTDLAERMPIVAQRRWQVPHGTQYTLQLRRDGQVNTVSLQTIIQPLRDWGVSLAQNIFGLLFLATALIVFLLKPMDKLAVLLALMLGTFSGLFNIDLGNVPFWLSSMVSAGRCVGLLFILFFLHFSLVFPERSAALGRFPKLEQLLYLPGLVILAGFIPERLPREVRAVAREFWPFQQRWLILLGISFILLYLVGGLLSMFWSYRAASVVARRKLRVVMAGSGAGFLNLLLIIFFEVMGLRYSRPELWEWINNSQFLTLPLVPIAFAYAIVRHQVIPVSLIIRRGIRYVLVSRGSVLIEALVVAAILTVLLTQIFRHFRPSGLVIGLVSGAVSIIAWNASRRLHERYLAPIIDRRFFRQSFDAQQILAELTTSLRTTTELDELLSEAAMKIQSALQAESVTIFLREEQSGDYRSAYACEYSARDGSAIDCRRVWTIPANHAGLERFFALNRPIALDAEAASEHSTSELPEALRDLNVALVMPLLTKSARLGLVALGPRLGDLPYSGEDERLLMSVAGPTCFAIENARLVARMIEEAESRREIEVDHQRKTEELAVARKLQLSLLPKYDLQLARLEIIGRMRTATEVGGDYYDFIETTDGRLCIAVGDATGHGMAAGLLVGMVKMGLTSGLHTLNGEVGVKRLIEDLNRALKQSLAHRGLGMCLSAAILDPDGLDVELISNGMPYPYHYRHATQTLHPLILKSPPLGFLKQVAVTPVRLALEVGDVLVWVSDGFGERFNHEGEMWGDETVEKTLARLCRECQSAGDIASRLIAVCDEFAAGRLNDDDMTVVVARVGED